MNPTATPVYSGMTSASFKKQVEKKKENQDERAGKQAQMIPAGKIIDIEISKIRTEIGLELANMINADTDKEDIKSIVIGLRLADAKLATLNLRLNNLLRVPKAKLKVDGDE